MKGAPRQWRAPSMSPAATRARIRVEETVSPSTSTSGTTRVSNSGRAASIAGSPFALAPKRKFSPTETRSAPSRSIRTCSMKSSARAAGRTRGRRGSRPAPRTPSPSITSRLTANGHDQLRQRRRVQDLERVGLEGEDGVGVVDHRLVAEVDAVEGADRDVARARLGVGSEVTSMLIAAPPPPRGPARRPVDREPLAGVLDPERADRGAAQVRAVGVAEGLDQGADVGPGRSTRSRSGRAVARARAARRGGPRRRASGVSTVSPRWAFL